MNSIRLVVLSIWVGASIFFGAVVAPAIFSVLRSFDLTNAGEIAGSIVTRCLSVVNLAGFVVGLFLLVTLLFGKNAKSKVRFLIETVAVIIIMLATGVGHWVIAARMHALRAAMALPVDQIRPDDVRRIEFNSLHGYSVNVLGLAMIAALVTIVLLASHAPKPKSN